VEPSAGAALAVNAEFRLGAGRVDVFRDWQHLRGLLHPQADAGWYFDWERAVFNWIDQHRSPLLDGVLTTMSSLSEWGMLWFVLLAFLYRTGDREQRRLVRQILVALFVGSVCVIVPLWFLLPRARPFLVLPEVEARSLPLHTSSFPSGHVKTAWLVSVVLGQYRPRFRRGLYLISALISYARMYDGMHWPLDVLAGAALGTGLALLLLHMREREARAEPLLESGSEVPSY
jgi:undecaprenyl-diphosphatase